MSTSLPYPEGVTGSSIAPATSSADRSAGKVVWWLGLGAAIATLVLGLMLLVWPEATLGVVAVLFGVWLLLHGIVRIVQAITRSAEDAAVRALMAVIGLLFVIGGVIALRNLTASLGLIVTIVGLSWLVSGVVELVNAFRTEGSARLLFALGGAISLLGGFVILIWPEMTLLTMVYLTGFSLVAIGVVQLVLVIQARKALTT